MQRPNPCVGRVAGVHLWRVLGAHRGPGSHRSACAQVSDFYLRPTRVVCGSPHHLARLQACRAEAHSSTARASERDEPSRRHSDISLGSPNLHHGCAANSRRREQPTRRSSVFSVNTLPRVARSSFRMSSRRTPKPAAADAGNSLELARALRHVPLAQLGQMLNARHLVARCAIVFGQLRLDHDLRIEFARNEWLAARTYGRTSEGRRSKIAS